MKPTKIKTFEDELKALEQCFNVARSKYTFSRRIYGTRGAISILFGVMIRDETLSKQLITSIKDIEIFRDQLITITKEKYASRKYIQEKEAVNHVQTLPEVEIVSESELVSEEQKKDRIDSIFNPKFPDQTATLLRQKDGCNQVINAQRLFDNLFYDEIRAQLLLAQTGAGKTYILASVVKNFIAQGMIDKCNCFSPWPIVFVTKASVVEQTQKVLSNEFSVDTINTCKVVNIEFLRSEFGKFFVKEDVIIENGQPRVIYKWNKNISSCLIIWDECQILAREESIQSQIAQAFNNVELDNPTKTIFQIFSSATPFSRVCEAKCFAVATRTKFHLGVGEVSLTNALWKQFAQLIAAPSGPYEYVEAAIKRLTDKLEPYIVRVRNVRPKHKAFNGTKRILFEKPEEAEEYERTLTRYLEEKAKIENDPLIKNKTIALLGTFTIFRKAAEKIRTPYLARWSNEMWLAGYAPVLACCFKGTITRTYKYLVEEFGWTRDDVSIIWGGSTETLSKKKKIAARIKSNVDFMELLKKEGISKDDLEDIGFDLDDIEEKTEEQLAFEKLHKLTSQNPQEREVERIKFQSGKSRCCIFSFKSGGVGLSLHHDNINGRQRIVLLTPVYSEKELIQGLGRCPRITSLSDTYQWMCYYGGTIEDAVAGRVKRKLKCVRQVSKMPESWESIVAGDLVKQIDNEALQIEDEELGNTMMEVIEE